MARKTIKGLEEIILEKNQMIRKLSNTNLGLEDNIKRLKDNQLVKIELFINPKDKEKMALHCGIKQFIDIVKDNTSSSILRVRSTSFTDRLNDSDVYDILINIADEYKPVFTPDDES